MLIKVSTFQCLAWKGKIWYEHTLITCHFPISMILWHFSEIWSFNIQIFRFSVIKISKKKCSTKSVTTTFDGVVLGIYFRIQGLFYKGHACDFLEKGQKGQNIWKFGQKCTKFENILKKGRWLSEIIACNKLVEKTLGSKI